MLTAIAAVVSAGAALATVLIGDGDNGGTPRPAATAPIGPQHGSARRGAYEGSTSQGQPVDLRLADDEREVLELTVPLELRCDDGESFTSTFRQGESTIRIGHDDVIDAKVNVRAGGGQFAGQVTVRATFSEERRRVTGTLSEQLAYDDGRTCKTPTVRFTAAAVR